MPHENLASPAAAPAVAVSTTPSVATPELITVGQLAEVMCLHEMDSSEAPSRPRRTHSGTTNVGVTYLAGAVLPRRRGRPRKHLDDAAKQKEYRNKKSAEEIIAAHPDSKGRLRNERSGERPRSGGMSEIERINAAKERGKYGRRVRPQGAGPDAFELPPGGQKEPSGPRALGPRLSDELAAKNLDEKMAQIGVSMFENDECLLCGVKIDSHGGQENHVWGMYEKGLRAKKACSREKDLCESVVSSTADTVLQDFARERLANAEALLDEPHYLAITKILGLWGRANFVTKVI